MLNLFKMIQNYNTTITETTTKPSFKTLGLATCILLCHSILRLRPTCILLKIIFSVSNKNFTLQQQKPSLGPKFCIMNLNQVQQDQLSPTKKDTCGYGQHMWMFG